jgi:uncharacterized membrane protein YkoI
MKKNEYFVKSIVALSLIGTLAMADSVKESNDDENNLQIKSSIQVSDQASEEFENKEAKIGVEKVTQVIKSKFSGKILSVQLENKNGNLVYIAEVFKNNQITDIIVDAGNGKILASKLDTKDSHENDDENDNEEHGEKNEAWYKF